MARYIDADALIEDFTYCGADEGLIKEIIHRINLNPTADVVPKSEVEELIYKLECLLCHATGGRLSKHTYDLMTMEAVVTDYIDEAYNEGKETTKSEVAKTLDELIEAAGEIADSYKKEADSMSYSDFSRTEYRGTQIGALLVQYKIAELKKKYTEGE